MTTDARPGSHEQVLDDLGRRIAAGDIAEGSVLTLAGLEEQYGMSRTVIREAVRVLETHGMIRSRRRVGLTVQPRGDWHSLDRAIIRWTLAGPRRQQQLEELMELRSAVEPAAARLAAERATPEQRRRIADLGAELDALGRNRKGDSDEYLTVDIEFHTLLLVASGNPLLAQLAGPVSDILIGRQAFNLMPAIPREGTLDNHLATALAVAASDPVAAERGARAYVDIISDEIREG